MAALAVVFFMQFFVITALSQSKNGWTDLIKNNSLQGWKKLGGGGLFTIENGAIVGTSVVDSVNTFL
ncbi:MAG: hypothetical protein ABIU77_03310, partial [Ferruginibacter sp.]